VARRALQNPTGVFLKHLEQVEGQIEAARLALHQYRMGENDELDVLNAFSDARKAMDRLLLEMLEK
jgi:hypothetical protein